MHFLVPSLRAWQVHSTYVVALLDPLIYQGRLRALASLDVRVPPGPVKFPLKEMFQVARAMKFSKHKMNDLLLDEKNIS